MITKAQSYITSDGNIFATLEMAQQSELLQLLLTEDCDHVETNELLIGHIIKHREKVVEILGASGRKPRRAAKKTKALSRKVGQPVSEIAPPDAFAKGARP